MGRRHKRTDVEVFSLSFLDCICCGFGAMILLFVLTIAEADKIVTTSRTQLEDTLDQKLAARTRLLELIQRLTAQIEQLKKSTETRVSQLGDIDRLIENLQLQIQTEAGGKKNLLTEIDTLKNEIGALQKEISDVPQIDTSTPIGIPVESNYVAFVIDTSGSMRDPNTEAIWGFVLKKFSEVIRAYPQVKGVQFLDADGRFIIGRSGDWIPDSPEIRDSMLQAIRRYRIFSSSNPVPGIERAIRVLHDPKNAEMKMGIYVFGDEFTETSDRVLDRIDKLNAPDATGRRPVTINGIGFPTGAWIVGFSLEQTGLKFANLLRELAWRNGGAFIAVTEGATID